MSETRDGRLAAELQKCASAFIAEHANHTPMITVTNSCIGADGNATIFITALPEDAEVKALQFLKRMQGEFHHYLTKHVRTKRIPRITFVIDTGEKNRQHLDTLLQDGDTSAE